MQRRDFLLTALGAAAFTSASAGPVLAQGGPTSMHPPKYKALQDSTAACVSTGEDCLRHCLAMTAMHDTSMAACEQAVVELIAACRALQTLASVNSTFTPAFARNVAAVCDACRKECEPFVNKYLECKASFDACTTCAAECRRIA
ncbi:MAG: four-helix bundle copper-binding protein [Vicinamibacterales bacterium]